MKEYYYNIAHIETLIASKFIYNQSLFHHLEMQMQYRKIVVLHQFQLY